MESGDAHYSYENSMTRAAYHPEGDKELSMVLLETLEKQGADLSAFVLYDYVDVDALEDIFDTEKETPAMFAFELEAWLVTIRSGDVVTIEVQEGAIF